MHNHHWLIEVDTGQPYLKGQCECGAVRDNFQGRVALLDRIYNINREKSKLGAKRMMEVRNGGKKLAVSEAMEK